MTDIKRRKFLKWSVLAGAVGITQPFEAGKLLPVNESEIEKKPIVISTWSHGLEANKGAWQLLEKGGKSLDAVEKGVKITEADITNRSVGIGGMPDRDGHVTLDACIMDQDSNCGAVACLEGIAHPISVARAVMEKTQHVMLVGEGAKDFALDYGFSTIKTPIKPVKKEYKAWKKEHKEIFEKPVINHENHDTIGMLAMDVYGNISGACTTSGWAYKMHGRVGDSPIIGAGLFIDNEVGGAVATGLGEAIVRIAGSHTVVELMRQGYSPEDACKLTVERIIRKHKDISGLQCCFMAMDKFGKVGSYSVFNGFNYALKTNNQEELVESKFNRPWE